MKRVFTVALLLMLVLVFSACNSQKKEARNKEAGVVVEVEKVGAPITTAEITDLSELMAKPADYLGKTLVIEGHVNGRCEGSGCWVSIATNDSGKVFYVKSADESFVFPEKCMDHDIRVQGVLKVLDKEKAEAHEHKKVEESEEQEDHICPTPKYFLDPLGVEIMLPANNKM